jgi:hypothetical protein
LVGYAIVETINNRRKDDDGVDADNDTDDDTGDDTGVDIQNG